MSDAVPSDPPAADDPLPPSANASLELSLHPDDAERLTRHPEFLRQRSGRMRTTSVRLVWADTPEGTLASEGLALCERRAGRETLWRLERLRSAPHAPWLPGAPVPVLSEGATLATLDAALPTTPVPVAACDGTLRVFPLGEGANAVTLSLLHVALRAVSAERPACRVQLDGPAPDIEALALVLSQSLRLSVPAAGLAAEAMANAGRPLPPRPHGAPTLSADIPAGAAFAELAGRLTEVLLHLAPHVGDGPEPVHQMRVALRRLRSAMSLFARAVGDRGLAILKQDLKILQQHLGPARDWDVFLAGTGRKVAAALPDDRPVARLMAAADKQRQDAYAALRAYLDSAAFRQLGIRLACLAAFRPWEAEPETADEAAAKRREWRMAPLRVFAAHALDKRLERLLAPGKDLAGLSANELHNLRILGKRMRYAAEFFAALYPGRDTVRFIRRTAALQDRLGHLNDGAVAATLMAALGGTGGERGYAIGVVRGFVAAEQRGARAKVDSAWRKFRRAEPFWQ